MHNTHGTLKQLDTLGQNKATFFFSSEEWTQEKKVITDSFAT